MQLVTIHIKFGLVLCKALFSLDFANIILKCYTDFNYPLLISFY